MLLSTMTLTIAAVTPQGIVLGADTRQTTVSKRITVKRETQEIVDTSDEVIGKNDNVTKIFPIGDFIGVTSARRATINRVGVEAFLQSFTKERFNPALSVESTAHSLYSHLETADNLCQRDRQAFENLELMLAGYDNPGSTDAQASRFLVQVPGGVIPLANARPNCGFSWTGDTHIMTRIIDGVDPDIDLSHINKVKDSNDGRVKLLEHYRLFMNWDKFDLEIATDFVAKMIGITGLVQNIAMRGVDFVRLGNFRPGVYGLDIAIIDPVKGFYWHTVKGVRQEAMQV